MNSARWRIVVLGLVATTVGACGDPLGPSDVAGRYVLQYRDGKPLPVLLHAGGTVDVFLNAETLLLRVDGTGVITVTLENRRVGGETDVAQHERHVAYRIVNGRIEIDFMCGPLELCTPPPHLVLQRFEGGLRTIPVGTSPPNLSYARVATIY